IRLPDSSVRVKWTVATRRSAISMRSARGSLATTLHLGPVDHVEERGDVVRPTVLVLQVVRVLPHVQAQDRGVARTDVLHQRIVLVGAVLDRELALGIHREPGPAAAEAALGGGGELFLERVKAAQVAIDAAADLAFRLAATL